MTEYLVIYEQGDSSWGAYSPDLAGVAVVGDSREEVERLIGEAIPFHLAGLRADGIPVPASRNAAGVVAA
ncbi:MAG: type II toxin-antitoxin system HicB family antitoxin [Actinomycetota bacterium]|nr:type II toxin-antitoxin system HicB family antitoxin [Actinomycetota bacterium]